MLAGLEVVAQGRSDAIYYCACTYVRAAVRYSI